MTKTRLDALPSGCPPEIAELLGDAPVYDSSCSDRARVYFIDRDGGFFLKRAPLGDLREERTMTGLFGRLGLGPELAAYAEGDCGWMLTRRVPGEDGTHYLEKPDLLCAVLGSAFRELHDRGLSMAKGVLLPDRAARTLAGAERGLAAGTFHEYLRTDRYGIRTPADARSILESAGKSFRPSCLIHGDACLPNVMIHEDRFSGFVDYGAAGWGNRHSDLFWTVWSLAFNLKTDAWADRFLDAYGRDAYDPDEMLVAAAAEAVTD